MYVLYIIIITFVRLLTLSRRSITNRIIKVVVERGKSFNFFFFFLWWTAILPFAAAKLRIVVVYTLCFLFAFVSSVHCHISMFFSKHQRDL